MLVATKATFNFESDQELVQLYCSDVGNGVCFEENVLAEIMRMLGLSRNFFLESKLMQASNTHTLQFYMVDEFLEFEFFKKKEKPNERDARKERFLKALDFLNKQLKKGD